MMASVCGVLLLGKAMYPRGAAGGRPLCMYGRTDVLEVDYS